MRTFNNQISKQTAIGIRQGRIAAVIGCGRTGAAAQHLGSGHAARLHQAGRGQLSQLWHGLWSALAASLDSAWHCASALCAATISGTATDAGAFKPVKSTWYSMSTMGLVPVAVRRLPVANAIGMPMPGSADC
jgi:hypothetical protein